LSDAARDVARILGGSGSRVLTQYGIHMDGVGTKTEQAQRALVELSKKLDGQASSSVQNFGSQVDVAKTKVSDWVDEIAGPVGNVLTTVGTIVGITGGAFDIYGAIQEHLVAKEIAATAAIDAESAALVGQGAAADAASKGLGAKGLGSAVTSLATGPVGFLALATAALYGISALGSLTDAAYNNTIQFKDASDAAAAYQKQVLLGSAGTGAKGFLGNADSDRGALLKLTTGANASVGTAAEEFNKWKDAAKQAGISTADLNADFPAYIKALKDTGTTLDKTSGSTLVFADATKEQAKALTDATSAAIKSVSPLTDFGSVVTDVQKKLQDSATATAAATRSTKDSAANFYDGSSVSLAQFTDQLTQNDAAGQAWLDNIQKLAQTQPEIAAQFEAAGYTAVNSSMLQQLIDATPEQSAAYIKAQTDAIAVSRARPPLMPCSLTRTSRKPATCDQREDGHRFGRVDRSRRACGDRPARPGHQGLGDPAEHPGHGDVSGADGKISGLLHKFESESGSADHDVWRVELRATAWRQSVAAPHGRLRR
jgi:hypothetical protein